MQDQASGNGEPGIPLFTRQLMWRCLRSGAAGIAFLPARMARLCITGCWSAGIRVRASSAPVTLFRGLFSRPGLAGIIVSRRNAAFDGSAEFLAHVRSRLRGFFFLRASLAGGKGECCQRGAGKSGYRFHLGCYLAGDMPLPFFQPCRNCCPPEAHGIKFRNGYDCSVHEMKVFSEMERNELP